METPASKFLLLFLLFILLVLCTSGSFLSGINAIKRVDEKTKHSYRRELIQTIQHDFMNPPITTYPTTTPVTNPVTTPNPATVIAPPDTSTPPDFPIPAANPATATPNVPITDPIYPPTPITNPVTTPSTTIPGGQPPFNPVTTPPPALTTPGGQLPFNPVTTPPPALTNAPAVPGQSWCVARGGLPETTTQVALDYACGLGGADCSAIQQGGSCYTPSTLQNHASYAFNSYYQKNPVQTSCDFGGAAMITNLNPSTGSCVFTTLSSSTTSPIPVTTPTPTTESSSGALPSSYGTPPNSFNASSPALGGGYGENPPTANISKASMSSSFQPLICCIVVVISIITGRIDFNI
ncbi:hypothetical protein ACS0TY_003023 [Phlomoides rotata]